MADLKQALIWLAEGKKVRKDNIVWQSFPDGYLHIKDNRIISHTGRNASHELDADNDNWELYEEPKPIPRPNPIPRPKPQWKPPELENALEDDGEYIVWDKNGNRDFAYWCADDKAFYSLCVTTTGCAIDVAEWKKLPKRDNHE